MGRCSACAPIGDGELSGRCSLFQESSIAVLQTTTVLRHFEGVTLVRSLAKKEHSAALASCWHW